MIRFCVGRQLQNGGDVAGGYRLSFSDHPMNLSTTANLKVLIPRPVR
jgi:hypothetical protein